MSLKNQHDGWSASDYVKMPYGVYAEGHGNGDWSINTFKYIMTTENISEWAHRVLMICYADMICGNRWPDKATHLITAPREQDSMTRDVGIYMLCCSLYIHGIIFSYSIPWYLYSPQVWAWHRYLKNPTQFRLKWWRFLERLSTPRKGYAIELKRMRGEAVKLFQIKAEARRRGEHTMKLK